MGLIAPVRFLVPFEWWRGVPKGGYGMTLVHPGILLSEDDDEDYHHCNGQYQPQNHSHGGDYDSHL